MSVKFQELGGEIDVAAKGWASYCRIEPPFDAGCDMLN